MSTAKPAMKFDQYDLSAMERAVQVLNDTGNEYTGKIATYSAVLTVKYDEQTEQHIVTALEPK